jgi:hypothetical protein
VITVLIKVGLILDDFVIRGTHARASWVLNSQRITVPKSSTKFNSFKLEL